MDVPIGFCVGVEDQVSPLYAAVTEVLLSFCVMLASPDCTDFLFHNIGTIVLHIFLPLREVLCYIAYTF